MPKVPRISDAEWEVMQVLWDRSPLTANEVVQGLAGSTDWNPRTIKTLLNRLVRKGALRYEPQGKRYLYRPAVTRQTCVRVASRSFAERVFGGRASSMLVHLVQDAELSPEQIDQLRKILDRKAED